MMIKTLWFLHILKYCFCRSHFLVFVRIQNTFSRVNVVLNRTTVIVDSDCRFDNLCCSHLQSQSEMYHVSWWYYTLLMYILIGQLRRDVICRLSVKPWCCWLWRLVISSNWCVSDPSIVTVKQSSIVSQIVSSPVVLSYIGVREIFSQGGR